MKQTNKSKEIAITAEVNTMSNTKYALFGACQVKHLCKCISPSAILINLNHFLNNN